MFVGATECEQIPLPRRSADELRLRGPARHREWEHALRDECRGVQRALLTLGKEPILPGREQLPPTPVAAGDSEEVRIVDPVNEQKVGATIGLRIPGKNRREGLEDLPLRRKLLPGRPAGDRY